MIYTYPIEEENGEWYYVQLYINYDLHLPKGLPHSGHDASRHHYYYDRTFIDAQLEYS